MKSRVVKRSIVIAGHKTSVSLEDGFWKSLKEIAGERHMTLSDLVASIDCRRPFVCSCSTSIATGWQAVRTDGTERATR